MASNTIAESGMARVLRGELCISGKLLRSSSYEGQQLTFRKCSIPKSLRGFAQELATKVERHLREEVVAFRQRSAANFLHRAELLYLECWKGKRILAANLPLRESDLHR